MKRGLYLILSLSIFTLLAFTAEDEVLSQFLKKLVDYNQSTKIEKVHLHFDKPYYLSGDTIWFKSYVVDAENQLSAQSKVLYVDLINEKGALQQSLLLPLADGLAWGDFTLTDSLIKGNYRVRAYTQWMRNFDEDFFFDKIIRIENGISSKTTEQVLSNEVEVQFFPEGGSLINNIKSKVGFKILGADGLGKNGSMVIKNKNGQKIVESASVFAGMGTFSFTPLANQEYIATVKLEDGTEKIYTLPKAQESGYVLAINNEDANELVVKISPSALHAGEEIILIGQSGGTVCYAAKSKLNGALLATIPKTKFPTGILQLTLLNSDYQPQAERLAFINHPAKESINLSTDLQTYGTRAPVKISLALDSMAKEGFGSFSLSVINENQVPFDDNQETTILSSLLLKSELMGYIEKPNYYFNEANLNRLKYLDHLMLIQGWRTFNWKAIQTSNPTLLSYQPEQGFSISGLVSELNKKPAVKSKVTLMTTRGTQIASATETDQQGRFAFNNLLFNQGTTFAIQAKGEKGKYVEIALDSMISPKIKNSSSEFDNNHQALANIDFLKEHTEKLATQKRQKLMEESIMLNEVKVKAFAKPQGYVENSSNLNGTGGYDVLITAKDLQKYNNLTTTILSKVAGMQSTKGELRMRGTRVAVRIDNNPFLGLNDINVNDIATIEVLKSGSYTGIYGGPTLIITTKRGGLSEISTTPAAGMVSISPQGYYLARSFYSPSYAAPINAINKDLRSTIYWSPQLFIKAQEKATLEFYTADKAGTYKAVVEGITSTGTPIRTVLRFTVK